MLLFIREKREEHLSSRCEESEQHLWERCRDGGRPGRRVRSKSPFLGTRESSWGGLSSPQKLLLRQPRSRLFLPILGQPKGRPSGAGGSHPSHLQACPTPGSCLPPAMLGRHKPFPPALLPSFGKEDAAAPGPCPEPRHRPPGQAQGSARSSAPRPRVWARAGPGAFLLPQEYSSECSSASESAELHG